MSDEHGWPDLHPPDSPDGPDEPGAHHDGGLHDEPGADSAWHDDDLLLGHDDGEPPGFDPDDGYEPGPQVPEAGGDGWAAPGHDDPAGPETVEVTGGHGIGPVGADPDAAPEAEQVSMFPPVVDLGPLPEPVDGFPWIDTGSLGLYRCGPVDPAAAAEPVPAPDLADYAAEKLAPGVDPWSALAGSDDPATSILAQWWRPES